jgi:hypothetical protein
LLSSSPSRGHCHWGGAAVFEAIGSPQCRELHLEADGIPLRLMSLSLRRRRCFWGGQVVSKLEGVVSRTESLSLRLRGCPQGRHVALRLGTSALRRWRCPEGIHVASTPGVLSLRRACCLDVGGWLRGGGGVFKAGTTPRHRGRRLLGCGVAFEVGPSCRGWVHHVEFGALVLEAAVASSRRVLCLEAEAVVSRTGLLCLMCRQCPRGRDVVLKARASFLRRRRCPQGRDDVLKAVASSSKW